MPDFRQFTEEFVDGVDALVETLLAGKDFLDFWGLTQTQDGKTLSPEQMDYVTERIAPYTAGVKGLSYCYLAAQDSLIPAIGRLIEACPNATSVQLSANRFTAEGVATLGKTLEKLPQIDSLRLGANDIGHGEGGEVIADLLADAPHIEWLEISENPLNDKDFAILSDVLCTNTSLHAIHARACNGGEKSHEAMRRVLAENRVLNAFTYGSDELPAEEQAAFADAIWNSENKNLDYTSPKLPPDKAEQVKTHSNDAYNRFAALYEAQPDAAQQPYADRAFVEEHQGLIRMLSRIPSHEATARNWQSHQQFAADLPVLEKQASDPLHTLFSPNQTGFAPLDNPRLWQNENTVWDALDKAGVALTPELLARETAKGTSFLESAMLGGRASRVLKTLNNQGIQLGKDMLVQDGEPTALFSAIIRRGDGPRLFTADNWRGAKLEDMQSAMQHLPDAQRERIANPYQLRCTVQMHEAAKPRGR